MQKKKVKDARRDYFGIASARPINDASWRCLLVIFVIGVVDVDRKTFPVCYEIGREGVGRKAAREKDFFLFFFFVAFSVSHPSYYEYLRVCFHFSVAVRCLFGKETRINGFFSLSPLS